MPITHSPWPTSSRMGRAVSVGSCALLAGGGACVGPRAVGGGGGPGEQAVQVQPVEVTLGLLHELEEVDRVAGRDQLTGGAQEADVQAADVAREVVVGGVAVER